MLYLFTTSCVYTLLLLMLKPKSLIQNASHIEICCGCFGVICVAFCFVVKIVILKNQEGLMRQRDFAC